MRKKQQQEESNSKLQTIRHLNAFLQKAKDEEEGEPDAGSLDRANTPPPPDPVKTRYNPDGIHDVITFCEHPYFLNLKLTPWQKLILKLFYCGEAGNIHLKIENERFPDCTNCVWSTSNKVLEERSCKAAFVQDSFVIPEAYMDIESSPCLQCKRFNREYREAKYNFLMDNALTPRAKDLIKKLYDRFVEDKYETEDDIFNRELKEEVRNQVKRKIGMPFQELILVLGRRSGKSFMVSVIALYEVYKLLMMKHPQSRFPIMEFDTINILNVANSEEQAKGSIFDKIKSLTDTSPYLIQHLGREATQLSIWFLTEHDKEENERRLKIGLGALDGTIRLISGHSNSASQVGGTIITIIIDEMAIMAKSESVDAGNDDDLYGQLKPSIATFGAQGKIICISNPLGPFGKFYSLYQNSFKEGTEDSLMFQLPTWLSNPTITPSFLRSQQTQDPINYEMQYGAEFGSTGSSPFLPEWAVNAAFEHESRGRLELGYTNIRYFAHLDPAQSSDNYSLVVLHLEDITNMLAADNKPLRRIVVDHIHLWRPKDGFPIDSNDVDTYIIELSSKFKFAQISYDQWGSQGSISKLQRYGLNVVKTAFSRNYQNLIFSEMYELFINERIDIYNIDTQLVVDGAMFDLAEVAEARSQLSKLQKKWSKNNTYKVEALTGAHDDIPDCIAAASYEALKFKDYQRLARPQSVYTGHFMR